MKKDIDKVIDRYAVEFDVSIAGVLGVLDMLKFDLFAATGEQQRC